MFSRIVFIGPQGSGKGTQAAKLSALLSVPHISTGDLFRSAIQHKTPTGVKVESLLAKGELVPDTMTNAVVAEAFAERQLQKGYILDGYPRTVAQAEYLDTLGSPDVVIVLALSDDDAVKRISGRRMCVGCKQMYHTEFAPSQMDSVCDACGCALQQRGDDYEEAVRERLRLYHQETEPIVSFYEAKGLVKRIDGRPSIDDVHNAIREQLQV